MEPQSFFEFDELLATREKNRVNIAREKQLALMGNTSSKMALEPFPPGSFEVLKSNQIWENVVSYVTDPLDWNTLKNTCATFHDLLAEKATLTEVLTIMAREGYLQPIRRVTVPTERGNRNVIRLRQVHNNFEVDQNWMPLPDQDQDMPQEPPPQPLLHDNDHGIWVPPVQNHNNPPPLVRRFQMLHPIQHQPAFLDVDLGDLRHHVLRDDAILAGIPREPRNSWTWTPLHFRLVSKTWKIATEEAFMNEFSGQWQFDLSRFANENCKYTKFLYRSDKDLERGHQILKNSDRAEPLVQILEIFFDESSDGFSTKFLEFLDNYGSSVRGLIINWSSSRRCSPLKRYQRLLTLATRMPNLKMIMMQHDDFRNTCNPSSSSSEDLMNIQSLIDQCPFPKLPYLEAFSVKEGYLEENVILKEIFSKARNLKSLQIPTLIKDVTLGPLIEVLGQLRIVNFQQNDILFPDDLLKIVSWPLKELRAKNCCVSSHDFGIINRFANTLECLELGNVQLDMCPTSLMLPHLRKLYLGTIVKEYFSGLDFLIPLESLEDLTFVCPIAFLGRMTTNIRKYLIDVYEYVDRMEESNIWRCFPSLRKLRLESGNSSSPVILIRRTVEYRKRDGVVARVKNNNNRCSRFT